MIYDFVEIEGTQIRVSAIVKIGNSAGTSNTAISLVDGDTFYTGLSIDEVMNVILESAEHSRKSNFGARYRHGAVTSPNWRHRD